MNNFLNPIITAAGLQASFNASNDGLQVKITEIGLGQSAWAPTSTATALQNEVKRVPISDTARISDDQIHITAIDPAGGDNYWIREVGFYLDDGTLFAVWSSETQPLGYHAASSDFAISLDWKITAVPADSIEVIGTGGFSFAPATNDRRGVVRLYDRSSAKSSSDDVITRQNLEDMHLLGNPHIQTASGAGQMTISDQVWIDIPTGKLTITKAGTYQISAAVRGWTQGGYEPYAHYWYMATTVNGVQARQVFGLNSDETGSSNQDTTATAVFFHNLDAGDVIGHQFFWRCSQNIGINYRDTLDLIRVGDRNEF